MAKRVAQMGGTTAQVAAYVGIAKQIIIDTSTWRVHLMDGVNAGGIRLARFDEIPSLGAYMKTSDAQVAFLSKDGTAVKATSDANGNDIANTYLPTATAASTYRPKSGDMGSVSAYATASSTASAVTVSDSSDENIVVTGAVAVTVSNGTSGKAWVKSVDIRNASASVALGSSWKWAGGKTPEVSANCVLVLHWCNDSGVASLISVE